MLADGAWAYQNDEITETDRGQRDEAIVERVEERPFLVRREDARANEKDHDREERFGDEEFAVGDFRLFHIQRLFHACENVTENRIQSFARRLKRDEPHRYSQHGVENTEDLCSQREESPMPVADQCQDHGGEVETIVEFPFVSNDGFVHNQIG